MLYLFLTGESEAKRAMLLHTLAGVPGEECRFGYTMSGAPRLLVQHVTWLDRINSGAEERCLIIYCDKAEKLYHPLRLGMLRSLRAAKGGRMLNTREAMNEAHRGVLQFSVEITLGEIVRPSYTPIFQAALRATLTGAPLPLEGGGYMTFSHGDLSPSLISDELSWAAGAVALECSTDFVSSEHQRLAVQTTLVSLPTAGQRSLRVSGHNYCFLPQAISVIHDSTLMRVQAVDGGSDFEFFEILPTPSVSFAIIDNSTRIPICAIGLDPFNK